MNSRWEKINEDYQNWESSAAPYLVELKRAVNLLSEVSLHCRKNNIVIGRSKTGWRLDLLERIELLLSDADPMRINLDEEGQYK